MGAVVSARLLRRAGIPVAETWDLPTNPIDAVAGFDNYEAGVAVAQHLEGGLRLGYAWNDGGYEMAVFGRNFTDEETIVGGIDFNNLTGFLNEPRTWGVEFKARF